MTAVPFKSVRDRWNADPEYRAAYAEGSPEMDLAFTMAEARHHATLSQAEVARRETGQSAPPTTSLRRCAEATGTRLRIDPDR